MLVPRQFRRAVTTVVLIAGLGIAGAPAAFAHPSDDGDKPHQSGQSKREQYTDGTSVPLISSPNVRLANTFPDVSAISGCFAKSAPYFYTSSLNSITVFDASDPLNPTPTGALDNLVFENEAMNCGEKKVDGVTTRFVLVGIDLTQTSSDDIEHVRPVGFDEFLVVDVTDPAQPYIRSRTKTSSSTHTVACVDDTACDYVYTAGGSVVDLTDLDNPREIKQVESPALEPTPNFSSGSGHKWNFDSAGYGLHTGSGGTAIFDVRDPADPKLVTGTDENGIAEGWNDFIHHNSDRPHADKFRADAPPSIDNGNVLLVTEEDYENTDCATAGSFQTWHVNSLDGTPEAVTPLDRINPIEVGTGVALPHLAFCSAHWFDYHQSGFVAQGFYEGGLRILDVRDATAIAEHGYFASGLSEVWDAYWVPERNRKGIATGRKTNIVYTADLVRGIDVFTVDLPKPGEKDEDDTSQPPLPLTVSTGSLGVDGVLGLMATVVFAGVIRRRRK
ncbi:MAG: hypothetical protein GEU86_13965 [Actinophytocola sp.]|nr:hypothetical protein [Actinophytocola sp.]